MNSSPLQFARRFEKLKAEIASQPASDNRLLLLLEFWGKLAPDGGPKAGASYVEEFKAMLEPLITGENLHDFRIDELKKLSEICSALSLAPQQEIVALQLASLYCWIGEIGDAIGVLRAVTGEDAPDSESFGENDTASTIDKVAAVVGTLAESSPRASAMLRGIHNDWVETDNTLSHEQVNCLFVEKDASGRSRRGRMRILKAQVKLLDRKAATDEVTFENQIKAPDDPFVGSLYNSLEAARAAFGRTGSQTVKGRFCHSHSNIIGSGHTFTGDSIGLAAALVSYCQLLHQRVLRNERFLSADTVVTGSVNEDGTIGDVNNDTLKLKIERAFFSPVRYLVLPESNTSHAREFLATLARLYPRRSLKLVFVSDLGDAIDDHNVIRSEKVCVGEFVVRKAASYTRTTKIQIPLLLALLYLLICILFPKAWVGFDWNPQYLQITNSGFEALNADSLFLWDVEMECPIEYIYSYDMEDIDNDGLNEVAYSPSHSRSKKCQMAAHLYLFDDNGDELWRRDNVIYDEYPVRNSREHEYACGGIVILQVDSSFQILTTTSSSYPSLSQLRLWSISGEPLQWYIHRGATRFDENRFFYIEDGLLLFGGINNNINSAVLYTLDVNSFKGVSPPYNVFDSLSEPIQFGNQLQYVSFPRTDIALANNELYNGVRNIRVESHNAFWIDVYELTNVGDKVPVISYLLDSTFRVQDVRCSDDFFITRQLLVDKGELVEIDWDEYREERKLAVEYWMDSCFVSERELRAFENNSK